MTQSLPLLAALFGEGSVNPWYKLNAATREHVIVVGVCAAITLLLLVVVALSHKPRRRPRERSYERSATTPQSDPAASQKRRKWRRRRREHRPRNPTLAETGGLPPLRTEDPSQSPL